MNTQLLTLFTRAPLHVGAGASVGAVDQPVVRQYPETVCSSYIHLVVDAGHEG